MTLEEMKRRKKEFGFSNKKIAEVSGVPIGTVQKIFSGETAAPRYDTIRALTRVLTDNKPAKSESMYEKEYSPAFVCEPEPAYNTNVKNRYMINTTDKTIEDYFALPEGTRVELIDGRFYDMAATTTIHQDIALEICFFLKDFVRKNGGKCKPYIAPTDVQLNCDNKTMVQPDVLVVCDRNKITKERIIGAPDFVTEVVSPGNAAIDVLIKMLKYKNAGVREYWIVFPDEKIVMVYNFMESSEPRQYTFEDEIPVAIWEGKCKVDFKYISSQIEV